LDVEIDRQHHAIARARWLAHADLFLQHGRELGGLRAAFRVDDDRLVTVDAAQALLERLLHAAPADRIAELVSLLAPLFELLRRQLVHVAEQVRAHVFELVVAAARVIDRRTRHVAEQHVLQDALFDLRGDVAAHQDRQVNVEALRGGDLFSQHAELVFGELHALGESMEHARGGREVRGIEIGRIEAGRVRRRHLDDHDRSQRKLERTLLGLHRAHVFGGEIAREQDRRTFLFGGAFERGLHGGDPLRVQARKRAEPSQQAAGLRKKCGRELDLHRGTVGDQHAAFAIDDLAAVVLDPFLLH
jgi:hypothetical protein